MLTHHLRRWPSIKPALIQHLVFAELRSAQLTQNICITFVQCWSNVEDVGPTLYKCYTIFLCLLGMAAGLGLLTAGGDYKPTPTQYMLNVEPASPVLASTHSVLDRSSCWRYQHTGGTGMML